jgi:hypothetical protein
MASDALAQAQASLEQLIDAARTGAIIPIRLTGQLEAIRDLVQRPKRTRRRRRRKRRPKPSRSTRRRS